MRCFRTFRVGDNLAFPLEVRRLERGSIGERVRRALRLVRLEGFEDRKPGELSGGQQQRVAIARALVFAPNLVLMDEPLGALDRRLREEMQYEIRRIHRTLGVTVVYVTHDQQEAMAMSDRVAVFNAGPDRAGGTSRGALRGTRTELRRHLHRRQQPARRPHPGCGAGYLRGRHRLWHRKGLSGGVQRCRRHGHPGDTGPERVALAPEAGRYSNEYEAVVDDIAFLGDHLRVRLSVCGSTNFAIKIPNTVGHGAILEDDRVRIGFTPIDCRALESGDGTERS